MKKAKENGVEIRLYESQEYTHDDMECLRVIAEGELDFLNQEWVINWNETDLIDYVNGDREPNYLYLVKAILTDCKRELSSNKEVKELLTSYQKEKDMLGLTETAKMIGLLQMESFLLLLMTTENTPTVQCKNVIQFIMI